MKKSILLLTVLWLIACNNEKKAEPAGTTPATSAATDSKAEKNKQAALAGAMGVNAHDVDAMLRDIAADAVDYGDGSMPPVKGVDSIKAGIKSWLAAFPDVKGENFMALTDDGTHVAVIADWTATFKNDFMGMKATGKSYKLMDADIFTFNNEGKITEHRSIQPNSNMMSQVGAKMPK